MLMRSSADTARSLEVNQIAERLPPDDVLGDRDAHPANESRRQVEGWLGVASGRPLEQLEACLPVAAKRRLAHGIERVLQHLAEHVRSRAHRRQRRVIQLIELIVG